MAIPHLAAVFFQLLLELAGDELANRRGTIVRAGAREL